MKKFYNILIIICIVFALLAFDSNRLYAATNELTFNDIEPYTTGSNQEWALWTLKQLNNSAEKIRLYDFLLRAHTFLMIYDQQDFIEEYYFVKSLWINAMVNFDEATLNKIQLMIDDENWTIDIAYPLERPFQLSHYEFIIVYRYFTNANPQFFLNQLIPGIKQTDEGLIPLISIPAYYAFAERRHKIYKNILYSLDEFNLQMQQSVDINNELCIIKYVHSYVSTILSINFEYEEHISREQYAANTTILGFFSDENLTTPIGYSAIIMYLLNSLEIPTINQNGTIIIRPK